MSAFVTPWEHGIARQLQHEFMNFININGTVVKLELRLDENLRVCGGAFLSASPLNADNVCLESNF